MSNASFNTVPSYTFPSSHILPVSIPSERSQQTNAPQSRPPSSGTSMNATSHLSKRYHHLRPPSLVHPYPWYPKPPDWLSLSSPVSIRSNVVRAQGLSGPPPPPPPGNNTFYSPPPSHLSAGIQVSASVHTPLQPIPEQSGRHRYLFPAVSDSKVQVQLKTIAEVESLKGSENLADWDRQILFPIRKLGLLGHICSEPSLGQPLGLHNIPIYPPPQITPFSTDADADEFDRWQENDNTVLSILQYRISSSARQLLPDSLTDGIPTTSRTYYQAIHRQFGLGNEARAAAIEEELESSTARKFSEVLSYTSNYRAKVAILIRGNRFIDFSKILRGFAKGLPADNRLLVIRDQILTHANLGVANCSHALFNQLLMNVEDKYITETQTSPIPKPSSSSSSKNTPAKTQKPNEERSQCSKCQGWGLGRTAETCRSCNPHLVDTKPTVPKVAAPAVATVASGSENTPAPLCFAVAYLGDRSEIYEDATPLSQIKAEDPKSYSFLIQHYSSLLDTACTYHIIKDRACFNSFDPSVSKDVKTASSGSLATQGGGICLFQVPLSSGGNITIQLHDCLYAPTAPFNLLSGGALVENRFSISLDSTLNNILLPPSFVGSDGQRSSWLADFHHRLFFLQGTFVSSDTVPPSHELHNLPSQYLAAYTFVPPDEDGDLTHRHLCHAGKWQVHLFLRGDYVTGLRWNGKPM
ncbi:hypothetical protein VNI00_018986 [Paramarasmius palmivorus]|uniref:Retrovirus-related Pol polyprotein from transposon TNT 1-94-like beta-barrel domain-containing protein n=1 Tax=Paramarasmius palmivorus TaxID=297713 RepID=A0AAW0ARB1_9AGAR